MRKQYEDLKRQENLRSKIKVTLGIEKIRRYSSELVGFLREKLD